ncbi:MAG: hypothetical protein HYX32_01360 [Actinobacteria bacterium]|nr:hypothetical protein [Actinomycetota bacterium]
MAAFDAELYLRLAGEAMILEGPNPRQNVGWSSPTTDAASALVAVDALPLETAETITRDYEIAMSLRGDQRSRGAMFRVGRGPQPSGTPFPPARVAVSGQTVETSWGSITVHHVLLGDTSTAMHITATDRSPGGFGMRNIAPVVRDDRGTAMPTFFSGGGGSNGYRGELSGAPALSPSTAWIELDGTRIDLRDNPVQVEVRIEELEPSTPAERHLRQLLASSGPGPRFANPDSIEDVISVLVACGAIQPEDRAIKEVRAVGSAMQGRNATDPDLPPRWRSVMSRSRNPFPGYHDSNDGGRTIVVGAATPAIDGAYVRVDALIVSAQAFAVEVAVSPGHALGPGGWGPVVGGESLSWWAEDDRGNHYLGTMTGSSGSDDYCRSTVQFGPPLDPAAELLMLQPTGSAHRAVVTIPIGEERA